MFDDMIWLNEPLKYEIKGNNLSVQTGKSTDFWRETFYGFIRDNGHFLYKEIKDDFTVCVTFAGEYKALYDQAGLMIRVDEKNWIKTGVEFTDSELHISTVVTRDFSDWSIVSILNCSKEITIQLTRYGSALRIQYLDENGCWKLVRLAYLDIPEKCQIGIMCCSPEREGFEVEFKDFVISEAISKKLHE